MIVGVEGDTPALLDDAKAVVLLLHAAYPGHPWVVRCMPGLIFIRHFDFPKNWGVSLRVTEADHDAAVLKKKVVTLAGEWLERAGIKRGRYDAEQPATRVEGVPEKDQPMPLPTASVVLTDELPERDMARGRQ